MQSRQESAYPRNVPALLLSGSVSAGSAGGVLAFSVSEAEAERLRSLDLH